MKVFPQSLVLLAAVAALVVVDSAAAAATAAASTSSAPSTASAATSPHTTSFPTMRAVKRQSSNSLGLAKDTFYSAAATTATTAASASDEFNVQVFECDKELNELAGPKKIHGTVVRLCFRPNAKKEQPQQQPQQQAHQAAAENDKVCTATIPPTGGDDDAAAAAAGSSTWQWEMEYKKGWVWEMEYKNGWAERKAVMDGSSSTSSSSQGGGVILSLVECLDQGIVCYLDTILSSGFEEPADEDDSVMSKGWASLTAIASPIVFKYKYYQSGKKKGRNARSSGVNNNVCS
jgi:hypothetical protein